MKTDTIYRTAHVLLAALMLAGLVWGAGLFLTGCNTLDGERYPNQKPIVHFANIPPEGQTFSRNPIVYWYGTDADGLIDYYVYHVAKQSAIDPVDPDRYILGVPPEQWDTVDVDPAASDPNTTHQIPLQADSTDPVRTFVTQYVFLRAYDMEGLGSDIVYRRFARNDNPPNTGIFDFSTKTPFVNAPKAGGAVTGIALDWWGTDEIDYPNDPPPFEFQWRLYGPYTADQVVDMESRFVQTVFQSVDGFVYLEGEIFEDCDTVYVSADSIEVNCDTYVVGTDQIDARLGYTINDYFNFNDASFQADYGTVVDSSCVRDPECLASLPEGAPESDCPCLDTWVSASNQSSASMWSGRDTLYNVYRNDPGDSTRKRWFLFWVRSRDDASVPDPTPAWAKLDVIEPKFERDVMVFDWANSTPHASRRDPDSLFLNPAFPCRVYEYWRDLILAWDPTLSFEETDYIFKIGLGNADGQSYGGGVPLEKLLQYKVVILYNDHILPPPVASVEFMKPITTAIDAGVNMWSTGRAIAGGQPTSEYLPPNSVQLELNKMPWGSEYKRYFAVNAGRYTGWWAYAYNKRKPAPSTSMPAMDLQDCMGAYSLEPDLWPDLEYDSARVHGLFGHWQLLPPAQYQAWVPQLPYLPEINWCEARYGATIMYLYKSHYGSRGVAHPLGVYRGNNGPFNFNYQGAPCGHRYNAGVFRTVHMNLTPYGLARDEDPTKDQATLLVKSIMDFLYDAHLQTPVAEKRYDDAAVPVSLSEQRARYWKRCDFEAYEKGLEISPHALENLQRR